VLPGVCGALIYDDSYNSSPASLRGALDVLAISGMSRRIAVIGDMLELGDHADEEHRAAGQRTARAATYLVAVGEHARVIADAALAAGMPPDAVHVATGVDDAAERALELCAPDTAVLVKASHGLHLEQVVARLRA
jgi:UDP-N-acetylmuramoyl-tripeptide--D-alanyl-D-alanine ligase